MDMVNTMIETVISMKVSGRTICLMEKDKLSILMAADTMVSFSTTGDMGKVSSCRKDASLREILPGINSKEKALWKAIMDKGM